MINFQDGDALPSSVELRDMIQQLIRESDPKESLTTLLRDRAWVYFLLSRYESEKLVRQRRLAISLYKRYTKLLELPPQNLPFKLNKARANAAVKCLAVVVDALVNWIDNPHKKSLIVRLSKTERLECCDNRADVGDKGDKDLSYLHGSVCTIWGSLLSLGAKDMFFTTRISKLPARAKSLAPEEMRSISHYVLLVRRKPSSVNASTPWQRRKPFRIALLNDAHPVAECRDGKATGLMADLVRKAYEILGAHQKCMYKEGSDYVFCETNIVKGLNDLTNGSFDAFLGLYANPTRVREGLTQKASPSSASSIYDFISPLYRVNLCAVTRMGENGIKSISDLYAVDELLYIPNESGAHFIQHNLQIPLTEKPCKPIDLTDQRNNESEILLAMESASHNPPQTVAIMDTIAFKRSRRHQKTLKISIPNLAVYSLAMAVRRESVEQGRELGRALRHAFHLEAYIDHEVQILKNKYKSCLMPLRDPRIMYKDVNDAAAQFDSRFGCTC